MPTLKDVATEARVSIATVSNYINHTKPVSDRLAKRIDEAILRSGYARNVNARVLKTNRSNDIGIILPNFNDAYYVQIYQGIKTYFEDKDYFLNLVFSNDIPDSERKLVKWLLSKRVGGLIVFSCCILDRIFYKKIMDVYQIPIVFIDREIDGLGTPFLTFNNRSNMHILTDYALEHGSSSICLITGNADYLSEAESRKGYTDALKEHNLPLDERLIISVDMNKEDSFRKTISILSGDHPQVDTFITTSSSLCAGVIEGLTLLGYSRDAFLVYTYGEEHWNLNTHSFANNSLVRPALKMGKHAAMILNERMEQDNAARTAPASTRTIVSGCRLNKPSGTPTIIEASQNGAITLKLKLLDTSQSHAMSSLLRNFETKFGVRADIQYVKQPDLYQSIIHEFQGPGTTTSDIFMYDIPWLPALASSGILTDITQHFSELNPDKFIPNVLKYFCLYSGRYYGTPFMYAPQVLYYRRDLFEDPLLREKYKSRFHLSLRPPKTMHEFNSVVSFFSNYTDVVQYGTEIPAAYDECLSPEIHVRLRAFSASLFDSADGSVCIRSDAAKKAFQNFSELIACSDPDYNHVTDISAAKDFVEGKIALLITYPSFLNDIVDFRKGHSQNDAVGYSMIPGNAPLLGGWGMGISSKSPHKSEAFEFLRWSCDEQISNYNTLLGGLSVMNSSYENDELNVIYPWLPLYKTCIQYSRPILPPVLPNRKAIPMPVIDEIVCRNSRRLFNPDHDVDEVLFDIQKELSQLLTQYRA